jgi:DNA replicative helicase MCM subunit Mcm2 (Cdc46/Mcm family)
MTKHSALDDQKKREKIQLHFWNEVGSVEHISLPKLKDAVKKEFGYADTRQVEAQIRLMQTEARIRIQTKVKVWIKQPQNRT